MQKGKAVFFGIVMILVNFCIAVCIQGLLFCPISSPLQAESLAKAYGGFENAHILDHTVLKDSELMLIEREGDVQILELQRNLFFPRYCLLEAHDIPEDDSFYTTAAVTSQVVYPYRVVDRSTIDLENIEVKSGFMKKGFLLSYGICTFLLTMAEGFGYFRWKEMHLSK